MGEPLSFMNWGFNPKGVKSGDYVYVWNSIYVYEDWYDASLNSPQLFLTLEDALNFWCWQIYLPMIQEAWDGYGEIHEVGEENIHQGTVNFRSPYISPAFNPPTALTEFFPSDIPAVLGGTEEAIIVNKLKAYCKAWIKETVQKYGGGKLPEHKNKWGRRICEFDDESEWNLHEGAISYYVLK